MDKVSVSAPWLPVASRASWPSSATVASKGIAPSDWSSSWTSATSAPVSKVSPQGPASSTGFVKTKEAAATSPLVINSEAQWVNKNTAPSSAWAPQTIVPPTKQQKKVEVAVQVVPVVPAIPAETMPETAPLATALVPTPPSELAPTAKSVIEEELSKQSLYKTELCRSFIETGICRYGHKCQFAHGEQELRPILRHPKYKTEHCKRFATTGDCPYGSRCRFIHTLGNAPAPTQWSNTWTSSTAPLAPFNKGNQTQAEVVAADDDDDQPRRLAIFQNLTKVN